jgi:hypothetical protein
VLAFALSIRLFLSSSVPANVSASVCSCLFVCSALTLCACFPSFSLQVTNRERITEYYQMVTRDPLHEGEHESQWQDMARRLSTRIKYRQTDYQSFYNLIDARHLVHLHNVFYHGRMKLINTLREISLGTTSSSNQRLDMKTLQLLVSLGPPSCKVRRSCCCYWLFLFFILSSYRFSSLGSCTSHPMCLISLMDFDSDFDCLFSFSLSLSLSLS